MDKWNKNALDYGKNPIPSPKKTVSVTQDVLIKTRTLTQDVETINAHLENDIRNSIFEQSTAAKCLRTKWNMHEKFDSFKLLGNAVIEFAKRFNNNETDEDGNHRDYSLRVDSSWGLIYKKDSYTDLHQHWPALWSYTYCVRSCPKCSPLVFPNAPLEIESKEGQVILFPSWVNHSVPKQECDHDRIIVAGNLMMEKWI